DRRGNGRPEPRADELLDRLAITQLHGHARRHPAAPEPSLDDLADGASPLVEDEGLARQVPGREGAGAPPPARGGGDGDQAARVRAARVPMRWRRGSPRPSSSWRTWRLTAGWLRWRESAAREKLPRRAISCSVRRWAGLTAIVMSIYNDLYKNNLFY